MPDRLAGIVGQQVLLGDIGDASIRIFRQQVIERRSLLGRTSSGIDNHHSSVLLNSGSMSKITPRNEHPVADICPI
jgi:hypothetical protein